jgi:hypothetical protein
VSRGPTDEARQGREPGATWRAELM